MALSSCLLVYKHWFPTRDISFITLERYRFPSRRIKHSDQLHLIQTFEPTGPDTLHITETYEDPIYFTRPWTIGYDMERQEYDLMEYICLDNLNKGAEYFVPAPAEGNPDISGVPARGDAGAPPQ